MGFADAIRKARMSREELATLLETLDADITAVTTAFTPTTWTPTFTCSGSMTIASITNPKAQYITFGKMTWLDLAVTASTLGGTANTTILFTLPATAQDSYGELSCFTFNNSASDLGRAFIGDTSKVWVRLRAAGNWTLGSGNQFRVTGWYRSA